MPKKTRKFDTKLDAWLYGLMKEWEYDKEIGNVSEIGVWYGLVHNCPAILKAAKAENLTAEELSLLQKFTGMIVREDDKGYVSVDYYVHKIHLQYDWERYEDELVKKAFLDEEDEEEDEDEDEPLHEEEETY